MTGFKVIGPRTVPVWNGGAAHYIRAQEGAAFYRFGRLVELGPVAEADWATYLAPRFRRGPIEIESAAIRSIVVLAEGIPYYVMRLCRALWSRGLHAGRVTDADVRHQFDDLVAEGDQLFAESWDALTLVQRRTLIAVAEGDAVFSERVRHAHELGPSSTLARSLERLQDLSFVARERARDGAGVRYRIVDPLLRAWALRGRSPVSTSETETEASQEPAPRRHSRSRQRRTR